MSKNNHHFDELESGGICFLGGKNQPGINKFGQIILILGIWLGASSFHGLGQTTASKIDSMPHYTRFLIVVDNTFSMRKFADSIEKAVINWVDTGLDGRVAGGDGFAIWSYSDFGPKPLLPTTTWRIRSQDRLLNQSLISLNSIRYFSRNRSSEIFQELQKALQNEIPLSVLWITDGKSDFKGSSFDLEIQKILEAQQTYVSENKIPFVITLEASNGAWQAWAVNRLTFNSPPFLLPAQPAFQLKPDPIKTEEAKDIAAAKPESETLSPLSVQDKADPASPNVEKTLQTGKASYTSVRMNGKETKNYRSDSVNQKNDNSSQSEGNVNLSNDEKTPNNSEESLSNFALDSERQPNPPRVADVLAHSDGLKEFLDEKDATNVLNQPEPSLSSEIQVKPLKTTTAIDSIPETEIINFKNREIKSPEHVSGEGFTLNSNQTSNQFVEPSKAISVREYEEARTSPKIWPKILAAICFLTVSGIIGYFLVQNWKKNASQNNTSKLLALDEPIVKGSLITATMTQGSKKRKKHGAEN